MATAKAAAPSEPKVLSRSRMIKLKKQARKQKLLPPLDPRVANLDPLPVRRERYGNPQGLEDHRYIRRTRSFPTKKDCPTAPTVLFSPPEGSFVKFLHKICHLEASFALMPDGRNRRCTLSGTLASGEAFTAIGDGWNKIYAQKAASLNAVAHLHESGALRKLYGALDQTTLKDEADAKSDVYNYAARFDLVPRFEVEPLPPSMRTGGRKMVAVTISLPEQNIHVSAHEPTFLLAEITASIKFKAEAEKHHAANGSDSIVIRDATVLTTANAKGFFDVYKMRNKGARVDVESAEVEGRKKMGNMPYRAQVLLNGEPIGEAVEMTTKKEAEELALLPAAIALKKANPYLYEAFQQAHRAGNGEILRPVPPVDLSVDDESVVIMRETLHEVRQAGLSDVLEDVPAEEVPEATRAVRSRGRLSSEQVAAKSARLRQHHDAMLQDPALHELQSKRADLPMNHFRAQVIDLVDRNSYSIIVGATGSGKTTQVPQILLEKAIIDGSGARCNIVCTQPRRIAATSVARRVAEERNEPLQQSVGYQVRFDAKLPQPGGSITFCTTGVLLQQLQHGPDQIMDGISHLVIDEVHERDIIIDFLLIILKKAVATRQREGKSTPKVVLMSATMDTDLFAGYFQSSSEDGSGTACPSLTVPGRTFPVHEKYLDEILAILRQHDSTALRLLDEDRDTRAYLQIEHDLQQGRIHRHIGGADSGEVAIDWKTRRVVSSDGEVSTSTEREDGLVPLGLVALTVAHIAQTSDEGAILVFLPGLDEILKTAQLLREKRPLSVDFGDASKFSFSLLHSSIAASQTDVFNVVPPGCRKIILATNIAETSITIPDVRYVVDTGKLREKQYDHIRRITKLPCTWISKSNSKQRAGRAGRVQNGHYYALFPQARYEAMRAIGLPEILRSDLQEICLDIKAQAFQMPIRQFLAEAIEPPSPRAVDTSVTALQGLEALTENEALTPLGRLLASLPVHPALGKMIVLGVIFRCLDPMLILGAAAGERGLFTSPPDLRSQAQQAKRRFAGDDGSDHIALINAVREMRERRASSKLQTAYMELNRFAHSSFIHTGAFRLIEATAKQIEQILVDAGLIPRHTPSGVFPIEYGHPSLNENSSRVGLIKALALAGMHPNLAVGAGPRMYRTPGEIGAMIHPSSINYPRGRQEESDFHRGNLLTYSTMARGTDGKAIFLRNTTRTSPLTAALFGGRLRGNAQMSRKILEMDGWLPFYVTDRADGRALKTVVEFKKALDRLLTSAFQDLSKRGDREGGYLADVRAREIFARGLVDVSIRSTLSHR
ncbi:MAG: hypothetical protein M1838_005003 [Thelocarpon superellum]|nr:MAG: hypothetical protein M1838_005003 [Thelocarpon superellum]